MMSVIEELNEFKNVTLDLITSLKEDKIHLVPVFLEKRQEIIDSLSKKEIDSSLKKEQSRDLQLLELEKELQEIYINKKQEIYIQLQEIKNNMAANNIYLFTSREPLNIIDKKI